MPRRRSKGWLGSIWKLGLVVAALAGAVFYGRDWLLSDSTGPEEITAAVTRGLLPITVTERGELESSKTVDVRCDVEGHQIKIATIVPEGTRVKKDQVVVTFDADTLNRSYADEEIKVKQAEGKARSAKGDLEVQQNKSQTDNDKAVLALKLAELDLKKYQLGDYVVDLAERNGEIELAKKDLNEAKEKLEHFRKFVRQGFGTAEQLKGKQLEVENKKFQLASKEAKLKVLTDYTRLRQETELTAKAKDAKMELERTRRSGLAAVEKAQSELESAEVSARLEKQTLERLKKQIDNCTVRAPQEGILVFSKERYWDASSRIQQGAMVHFQQTLFSLPDLEKMQVKVKIHESVVKKVQKGQKAEIRVDAYPNAVLKGEVEKVATLANSEGYWDQNGVKEYVTIVKIEALPRDAGLKPGMTAEVKVLVSQIHNTLMVPVQAVAQKGEQHYAYVLQGKAHEKREVKIGENNERFVQVLSGLQEGERVGLDARARISAESKAKNTGTDEAPKEKQEERAPAPPTSAPPAASARPG